MPCATWYEGTEFKSHLCFWLKPLLVEAIWQTRDEEGSDVSLIQWANDFWNLLVLKKIPLQMFRSSNELMTVEIYSS